MRHRIVTMVVLSIIISWGCGSGGVTTPPPNGIMTPQIIMTIDTPGIAHDVAVSGGYAFVADWAEGLHIFDINPPEAAHIVKTVGGIGAAVDVAVSGGYAYTATTGGTLFIIDIDPLDSSHVINSYCGSSGFTEDLILYDGYAYIANNYI